MDLEATISASIGVRGAHVTYGPAASAAGITAFVQIWAEPCCDLIVEVGPGNRDDEALQAFADGVRAALEDRGFEIGGNADNFRKTLPRAT